MVGKSPFFGTKWEFNRANCTFELTSRLLTLVKEANFHWRASCSQSLSTRLLTTSIYGREIVRRTPG